MKANQKGFIALLLIILTILFIGGSTYFYFSSNNSSQKDSEKTVNNVRESDSDQGLETYDNRYSAVEFKYPKDQVSTSTNYFHLDKDGRGSTNGERFMNFDIKSGGNFNFSVLEDSTKMSPEFSSQLDEVKFKWMKRYGENTTYETININGYDGYKISGKLIDWRKEDCNYESNIFFRSGFWYGFEARICKGDIEKSFETFHSVVSTYKFKTWATYEIKGSQYRIDYPPYFNPIKEGNGYVEFGNKDEDVYIEVSTLPADSFKGLKECYPKDIAKIIDAPVDVEYLCGENKYRFVSDLGNKLYITAILSQDKFNSTSTREMFRDMVSSYTVK